MKLDPFIEAEKQQKSSSLTRCCELFEVSRAAYYQRQDLTPTPRQLSDNQLSAEITEIHDDSGGSYGSPRVTAGLRWRDHQVSRRRVGRLMRQAGLEGRAKKKWRATTIADPDAAAAADRIKRAFAPGGLADARYVGDITYIAAAMRMPRCHGTVRRDLRASPSDLLDLEDSREVPDGDLHMGLAPNLRCLEDRRAFLEDGAHRAARLTRCTGPLAVPVDRRRVPRVVAAVGVDRDRFLMRDAVENELEISVAQLLLPRRVLKSRHPSRSTRATTTAASAPKRVSAHWRARQGESCQK